jgi:FtsH-binding integral membrane protein
MDVPGSSGEAARSADAAYSDEAQRSFLVRTFGWMFVGLGLTAAVALIFSSTGNAADYFEANPGVYVALLVAEIVLVGVLGLGMRRLGTQTAAFLYCLFAGVSGVLFGVVFDLYTAAQIAPAFAIAALMYGGAAAYGGLTRRDLGDLGSLLFLGGLGLLLALIFNIFWPSNGMYWLTTLGGVAIFTGMTAWTVQSLKDFAAGRDDRETENAAIYGAVLLSLEFLNVLLYALRFFGPGGPRS